MGEIGSESRYEGKLVAQFLYVAYAVVVVILLSNVLIAIVTDSYEIIQNDRAAIVFWSNRLDFVAEMDGESALSMRWLTRGTTAKVPPRFSRRSMIRVGLFISLWLLNAARIVSVVSCPIMVLTVRIGTSSRQLKVAAFLPTRMESKKALVCAALCCATDS